MIGYCFEACLKDCGDFVLSTIGEYLTVAEKDFLEIQIRRQRNLGLWFLAYLLSKMGFIRDRLVAGISISIDKKFIMLM